MNRITPAKARDLVGLWCQTFRNVPPSVCLALMEIESSFNADAHAKPRKPTTVRDVANSGAWGLMQLLQPTAADMVRKLERKQLPRDVTRVLEHWDPKQPKCLTDPALGSLLGVAYLDHLAERFGPGLEKLAAAYHNGAGFLRAFLAHGKIIPDDMPPRGAEYIKRARAAWSKYSDADPIFAAEAPVDEPAAS